MAMYYLMLTRGSLQITLDPGESEQEKIFDDKNAEIGTKKVTIRKPKFLSVDAQMSNNLFNQNMEMAKAESNGEIYMKKAYDMLTLPSKQVELTNAEAKIVYDALVKHKEEKKIDFVMLKIINCDKKYINSLKK